jgi:hypothetical protein
LNPQGFTARPGCGTRPMVVFSSAWLGLSAQGKPLEILTIRPR